VEREERTIAVSAAIGSTQSEGAQGPTARGLRLAAGKTRRVSRAPRAAAICVALFLCALGGGSANALAATPAPHLAIHSFTSPSVFSPEANAFCLVDGRNHPACDTFQVTVTNNGALEASGPILIHDTIPSGLTVQKIQLYWSRHQGTDLGGHCSVEEPTQVQCEFPLLAPDETLEAIIYVTVEPGAEGGQPNTATVSSPETPTVSTSSPEVVSPTPASFGFSNLTASIAGADGLPETQAGGHPYEFTQRIDFNDSIRLSPYNNETTTTSVEDPKDVAVDLPLGFLGSALSTPTCTLIQLASFVGCPPDTVVGHIFNEPEGTASLNGPIYNVVPEHGVAAEFGFQDVLDNTHVIYASVAPSRAGYVVRATAYDVPEIALTDIVTTFYGDPAVHDESHTPPVAQFTNPAACTGRPLTTSAYADSWQNPGTFTSPGQPNLAETSKWAKTESATPPVTGCNRLRFTPSRFSFRPDTSAANSPTGMSFDLGLPQNEEPGTLGTPPLKSATISLPEGVIVNPASAGALVSCSTAQIGWLGHGPTDFSATAPTCPDASKIGSIEVQTPLIANTLVGSVYLAAQNENPFHTLLAGYIVIDDPQTGTVVKIAGKLTLDPSTGQITGSFNENPQLPFSDLKLRFFGGSRGELATPTSCGTFTTNGSLEPWSAPDSGPNATVSDSFPIDNGCTPGFTPAFAAGTVNPQSGGYSPLSLSFSRNDGEQEVSGLSVSLPPGLEGKLAGISQCPEANILAATNNPSASAERANPSCPANSRIGTVQATAGVGSEPFSLSGAAYLTGPYKGAPYGVVVVVPVLAGPFDLGTVAVRSSLQVDSTDAHVTVVSDPFPTIIDRTGSDGTTDGFPIRLRAITFTADRPEFTLNPTNCSPMVINATLSSTSGVAAPVSSRFQASGCRELPFHPSFAVSTQAHASKANGASLHIKVNMGSGQAHVAKVHVALPKQLPSRLSTLQKACLAATFAANPASCPPGSLVGTATVSTPLLANPLTGPAYLVSHGGAAFPDLEIVLQGEGLVFIFDGITNIKKGITTSTFNTVPDAPFTNFELTLPQGPHSVLAAFLPTKAKFNMCGQHLEMPTVLTGQNGVIVRQATKITTTGCAVAHKAKRVKRKHSSLKHRKTK